MKNVTACPSGTFLVTDTPGVVEPHHRVVVWLGRDHGPLPGKVTRHAKTLDDFLGVAIEHIQPALAEPLECAVSGDQRRAQAVSEYILERYQYAARMANFDMNTLKWTYCICALQSIRKVACLPSQIHTAYQLADAHRDQACVIIGAGPSLDIHAIDPQRVLTIATTRTALLCLDAGWCPDYIVHVDPAPFAEEVARLSTHPNIDGAQWLLSFQVHENFVGLPGRTFWYGSRLNPASQWIARRVRDRIRIPLIISGGSVSCCAFTVADFMGCSPICLLGQDLSYQGGRKYHETEMASRFTSVMSGESDSMKMPGIGGVEVETTVDYASYAEWFVMQARHSRRKLINCTARGIQLPGFEHMPLSAVYERYASQKKKPAPDVTTTFSFVPPDVNGALHKADALVGRINGDIAAGNWSAAYRHIEQARTPESDEFLATSCTQYEEKIMDYYRHMPPDHPKMRRCIGVMAGALRDACRRIRDALDGRIDVPPVNDADLDERMNLLREINAL